MVYIFQVYMYMLFHVQNDQQFTGLLMEHSTVFFALKKLCNYVDFILLIVMHGKFSMGMYLSWLSQLWSVVSLSKKNLFHGEHGYQLSPRVKRSVFHF